MIRTGLIWTAVIFLLVSAASAIGWAFIDDAARLPVHWNINGEADRYAGKEFALLAAPVFVLALGALFSVLPLIDPRRENLERSRSFYLTAWIGVLALVALAHASILYTGVTGTAPSVALVLAANGVFFIALGNVTAKSRSNWFAGLRTPWTLSSEHAWIVAHRWAGRLWILTGAATLAASFWLPVAATIAILVGGAVGSALIGVVVSYFAWRRDPDHVI